MEWVAGAAEVYEAGFWVTFGFMFTAFLAFTGVNQTPAKFCISGLIGLVWPLALAFLVALILEELIQ